MDITRTFTHRTYGKVGDVTFTTPKGKYAINGTELPDASVAHLMTFALQTLQDAYAGAKSTDEALGAFNGKLDKLLNGTIGTRSAGDGADERTRVARSVVMSAAKAKFGAKSPEWVAFTRLDDAEQAAKLDEWFAEHRETFDPAVDEEMARREARRVAKTALAGTVAFTM